MAKTSAEFDIIGRIGSIKEHKTSNGKTVTYINVATTTSYPDKDVDGKFVEEDFWHSLTVLPGFEKILNKLQKGDLVRFEGDIRPWYDNDKKEGGVSFVVTKRGILARPNKSDEAE